MISRELKIGVVIGMIFATPVNPDDDESIATLVARWELTNDEIKNDELRKEIQRIFRGAIAERGKAGA